MASRSRRDTWKSQHATSARNSSLVRGGKARSPTPGEVRKKEAASVTDSARRLESPTSPEKGVSGAGKRTTSSSCRRDYESGENPSSPFAKRDIGTRKMSQPSDSQQIQQKWKQTVKAVKKNKSQDTESPNVKQQPVCAHESHYKDRRQSAPTAAERSSPSPNVTKKQERTKEMGENTNPPRRQEGDRKTDRQSSLTSKAKSSANEKPGVRERVSESRKAQNDVSSPETARRESTNARDTLPGVQQWLRRQSEDASTQPGKWSELPSNLVAKSILQCYLCRGKRTYQEEIDSTRHLDEHGLFMELVREVTGDLDGNTLCFRILRNVTQILAAESASLYLVKRCEGVKCLVPRFLDVKATSSLGKTLIPEAQASQHRERLAIGEGIIGYVAKYKKPVNCAGADSCGRLESDVNVRSDSHTCSILAMPVFSCQDKVIGVATLRSRSMPGSSGFNERDMKVFKKYALFCGIALANAEPLGLTSPDSSKNEPILSLAKIILEESSDVDSLMSAVMERFLALLNCERCLVFIMRDAEAASQQFLHQQGPEIPSPRDALAKDNGANLEVSFRRVFDCKISTSDEIPTVVKYKSYQSKFTDIAKRVVATKRKVNIEDLRQSEMAGKSYIVDSDRFVSRRLLALPVLDSSDRVLAVVEFINRKDDLPFAEADVSMADAVNVFFGLGIYHALLLKKAVGDLPRQKVALAAISQHVHGSDSETQILVESPLLCGRDIDLYSPSFDDRSLSDMDTLRAAITMFVEGGFVRFFELPMPVLCRWVCCVYKNCKEADYHSWRHAFSTAQVMFALLNVGSMSDVFGPVEMMAIMAACLCHELDHQEPQALQKAPASTTLASLYSSNFHERHHFTTSVLILESSGHNIFSSLTASDYHEALVWMGLAVQATDLSTHFYQRDYFRELVAQGERSFETRSKLMLLMAMMVTAADMATFTRPFHVHEREVQSLLQNFDDKHNTMPESIKNADVQVMFLDTVCVPVYEMLSQLWPNMAPWHDNVLRNRNSWLEKTAETEVDFVENAKSPKRKMSEKRARQEERPMGNEDATWESELKHQEEPLTIGRLAERISRKSTEQARLHQDYLKIVSGLKEAKKQMEEKRKYEEKGTSPSRREEDEELREAEEKGREEDILEVLRRDEERRRVRQRQREGSHQGTDRRQQDEVQSQKNQEQHGVLRQQKRKEETRVREKHEKISIEMTTRRLDGSRRSRNKGTEEREVHEQDKKEEKRERREHETEQRVQAGRPSEERQRKHRKEEGMESLESPVCVHKRHHDLKNGSPKNRPRTHDMGSDPMATMPNKFLSSSSSSLSVASRDLVFSDLSAPASPSLPGSELVPMYWGEESSSSVDLSQGTSVATCFHRGATTSKPGSKLPQKVVGQHLLDVGICTDDDNNASGGSTLMAFKSLCATAEGQNKASNHPTNETVAEGSFMEVNSTVSVSIRPLPETTGQVPVAECCQSEEPALVEAILKKVGCKKGKCGPCQHCGRLHCTETRVEWMAPIGSEFFTNFPVDFDKKIEACPIPRESKECRCCSAASRNMPRTGASPAMTLPKVQSEWKKHSRYESDTCIHRRHKDDACNWRDQCHPDEDIDAIECTVRKMGKCLKENRAQCCLSDDNAHCHETLVEWEAPEGSDFFTNCPLKMADSSCSHACPECHAHEPTVSATISIQSTVSSNEHVVSAVARCSSSMF